MLFIDLDYFISSARNFALLLGGLISVSSGAGLTTCLLSRVALPARAKA